MWEFSRITVSTESPPATHQSSSQDPRKACQPAVANPSLLAAHQSSSPADTKSSPPATAHSNLSVNLQSCRPFICPAHGLQLTQARQSLISQVHLSESQACRLLRCKTQNPVLAPAPDQESSAGSMPLTIDQCRLQPLIRDQLLTRGK